MTHEPSTFCPLFRGSCLTVPSTHRPSRRVNTIAVTSLLALGLGADAPATTVERYSLPGRQVAIYDLAGNVTVEPSSGNDVVVEVTRTGRDGSRLRVEQDVMADWHTLRVVFPSNRVVFRGPGARRRIDVGEDGRFGDRKLLPSGARRRVEVVAGGTGLEAQANLIVRVPAGCTVALYLAAGSADVTRVNADVRVSAPRTNVVRSPASPHVHGGVGALVRYGFS